MIEMACLENQTLLTIHALKGLCGGDDAGESHYSESAWKAFYYSFGTHFHVSSGSLSD